MTDRAHDARPNAPGIRSPRGLAISATHWTIEAPLRMRMSNLDREVAERPGDLVVYGGIGRAARDWPSYQTIVAVLHRLEETRTLLVQSGKPVGVLETHREARRLLIADSNLVPRWASWEHFSELDRNQHGDRRGTAAARHGGQPGGRPLDRARDARGIGEGVAGRRRATPRRWLSVAAALRGVTVHAAMTLGLADRGRLAPGLRCDLALCRIARPAELCYWIGRNPCIDRVVEGR